MSLQLFVRPQKCQGWPDSSKIACKTLVSPRPEPTCSACGCSFWTFDLEIVKEPTTGSVRRLREHAYECKSKRHWPRPRNESQSGSLWLWVRHWVTRNTKIYPWIGRWSSNTYSKKSDRTLACFNRFGFGLSNFWTMMIATYNVSMQLSKAWRSHCRTSTDLFIARVKLDRVKLG